jgi:hypothetical protein
MHIDRGCSRPPFFAAFSKQWVGQGTRVWSSKSPHRHQPVPFLTMQCVLGSLGRGWRRCPGFLDFRESKEARYAQPEASAKSINRAKDELVRVQSAENVIEDLRVIAHAKVVADAEADVDVDVACLCYPGLLSTIAAHAQSLFGPRLCTRLARSVQATLPPSEKASLANCQ